MAEENIIKKLRETFPKATKADWKQAASQEIDGKNPDEILQWNNAGSPAFKAYYDHSDSAVLSGLKNFQLPVSTDPFGFPRNWINLPKINVTNSATANAVALEHLQQGAEGVWLDLTHQTTTDFEVLLEKIEWPFCFVSLQLNEKDIPPLANLLTSKKYSTDSLTGIIFWKELPANAKALLDTFRQQQKVKTLGLRIPSSTPTTEIANALDQAVNVIDTLTNEGIDPRTISRQIAFSFSIGTNFFLEIAKLKAMRMLWFQVVQAYGNTSYQPEDLHLHAHSEVWLHDHYQPHGNLLKGTTASMAAVLGGCDSLTVDAEGEDQPLTRRIARNVSSVLREESHLNKVSDALAGAYALDSMTNEIVEKAWFEFQDKSKSLAE